MRGETSPTRQQGVLASLTDASGDESGSGVGVEGERRGVSLMPVNSVSAVNG
jgi:hypothetical protein